eukprot:2237104-Pyramimonas_sp.AAC.1
MRARATALATTARIMIWAKADGRWCLRGPSKDDQEGMQTTLRLTLSSRHCRRLACKKQLGPIAEKTWMGEAAP